MSLSTQEIKEIIGILEESGWDEGQVQVGDVILTVSKNGDLNLFSDPVAAAPAAVKPSPAEPAPAPERPPRAPGPSAVDSETYGPVDPGTNGLVVSAPSVDVFWRSPEPGAPPFVEVGDRVEPGQPLCIIEVMKLMNHVQAESAGVVVAIHTENGDHVEHGTPLFTIDTSA